MTAGALDVLAEVHRHGGDVKVVAPDRLRVLAPRAFLPELVARVRTVKAELLLVLAEPKSPEEKRAKEWRTRHAEALAFWRAFHSPEEAADIAWGELQSSWHRLYGTPCAPGICAGCGKRIKSTEALPTGDGACVHIATLDCLIAYGNRWRSEATAALANSGIEPPPGERSRDT